MSTKRHFFPTKQSDSINTLYRLFSSHIIITGCWSKGGDGHVEQIREPFILVQVEIIISLAGRWAEPEERVCCELFHLNVLTVPAGGLHRLKGRLL